MSDRVPQLTLDLFGADKAEFQAYHTGDNGQAVSAIRAWSAGGGPPVVCVWGACATGKSHLLQAAIHAAGRRGSRAMYLPFKEMIEAGPEILEDLEQIDSIAIDDLALCAGRSDWEQRLFHLYNRLAAAGGRLLWSAASPPGQSDFTLDDLASRLSASLVFKLRELSDGDKARALAMNAERRGLVMPGAVVEFIMRRERRDMRALADVLDALDHASLRDARALTIPFVRAVLAARDADE